MKTCTNYESIAKRIAARSSSRLAVVR